MPRVSQDSLDKLNAFIDSLGPEARNKCALCNETLVHLVKTAEVESGAGTATVTRAFADRINETAAPGDRVSGNALNQRVRQTEGLKMSERQNNPQPRSNPGAPESMKMTPDFNDAFDAFVKQVVNAKKEGWRLTTRAAVVRCVETINYYLET